MTCDSCLNKYGCSEARFGESVRCMRFKDETEWFHLPCKVGTQVFFLRDKSNIIETSVEKIVFKGKDGKGCYIKLECNAMYETSCQSIGKTVFFTRESAEKALAERGRK